MVMSSIRQWSRWSDCKFLYFFWKICIPFHFMDKSVFFGKQQKIDENLHLCFRKLIQSESNWFRLLKLCFFGQFCVVLDVCGTRFEPWTDRNLFAFNRIRFCTIKWPTPRSAHTMNMRWKMKFIYYYLEYGNCIFTFCSNNFVYGHVLNTPHQANTHMQTK